MSAAGGVLLRPHPITQLLVWCGPARSARHRRCDTRRRSSEGRRGWHGYSPPSAIHGSSRQSAAFTISGGSAFSVSVHPHAARTARERAHVHARHEAVDVSSSAVSTSHAGSPSRLSVGHESPSPNVPFIVSAPPCLAGWPAPGLSSRPHAPTQVAHGPNTGHGCLTAGAMVAGSRAAEGKVYPSRAGGGTGRGTPAGGHDDRAGLPGSADVARWRPAVGAAVRACGSGPRSTPALGSRTRRDRTPRHTPRRGTGACATRRCWPSPLPGGRGRTAGGRR